MGPKESNTRFGIGRKISFIVQVLSSKALEQKQSLESFTPNQPSDQV